MTGRGLRGRQLAQVELFAAAIAIGAIVFLILAEPQTMGPVSRLGDRPETWIGVATAVIALAWMIRIYRAGPEAPRSSWRFDRS